MALMFIKDFGHNFIPKHYKMRKFKLILAPSWNLKRSKRQLTKEKELYKFL